MIIRVLAATAVGLALAASTACSRETAPVATAAAPQSGERTTPAKIDNFQLVDQAGVTHDLYSMTDAKAVVIVMQGVGCPIVQKMTPDLKQVQARYEGKGVAFMMINSNIQDSPAMIAEEATKFELALPILKDADQKVGHGIGAVRTAETFVIDPKTWDIVYHGPLNDRLTYGREKAVAGNDFVSNVLDAVLAGDDVPVIHQEADGCIINFVEAEPVAHAG